MADTGRCVVIQDQGGFAMMIWWNGIMDEVFEGSPPCAGREVEEALDTKVPGQGFWVWEGIFHGDDAIGEGEFRRPSEQEWASIKAGRAPWPGGHSE